MCTLLRYQLLRRLQLQRLGLHLRLRALRWRREEPERGCPLELRSCATVSRAPSVGEAARGRSKARRRAGWQSEPCQATHRTAP
jgi:hypothetical protein